MWLKSDITRDDHETLFGDKDSEVAAGNDFVWVEVDVHACGMLIPFALTTMPRNSTEGAPQTHLVGLMVIPAFLIKLKTEWTWSDKYCDYGLEITSSI